MDSEPTTKNDHKRTSEEFRRFEDMVRKVVSVPKKDIQDREKKEARKKEKAGR